MAIEASRHHGLARQQARVHDMVHHRGGELWLGPQGHRRGDLASGLAGGLRLGKPYLRQQEALGHQGIALP